MGDTIFIFCLALIIFGPKKLPEIGRQIGKLMVEFRRASNEFKMQIEEELRAADDVERQKEITASTVMTSAKTATTGAGLIASASEGAAVSSGPVIAPPATGLPVNHTFAATEPTSASSSAEAAALPVPAVADAYPEPANGFNPGLNTASNAAVAESDAYHLGETPEPVAPSSTAQAAAELEKAPTSHA